MEYEQGKSKHIEVVDLLGKSKVEFCYHALEQMKIRGISERQVLAAIRYPDETGLPTQPHRERVRKFKNPKRAIDVVYEVWPDRIVVVTTFPKKFSGTQK
jgi:hypothetical protein